MDKSAEKIEALRSLLDTHGVEGFIVPREDEFQGEFAAAYAERLKWLTGFSGSAGAAIVLKDKAVVMSDGRYTIQLKQQTDPSLYETVDSTTISKAQWIKQNAPKGALIGYDPKLHTPAQISALELGGVKLKPIENLIDKVWSDQPDKPKGAVTLFPDAVAGKTAQEKCAEIRDRVREAGAYACVISMPDSVSWLLNVRGADLDYLPAVLSYAVVYDDAKPVDWIVDPDKLDNALLSHLGETVNVIKPADLTEYLKALAAKAKKVSRPVAMDYNVTPSLFKTSIEAGKAKTRDIKDPCAAPRALKTLAEQKAIRKAHIQDGAALVKFLHWLDENALNQNLNELDVEDKLLQFRAQNPDFKGPSFATIAGFGENGAIVHYRASPITSKTLQAGNMLLLDSGGQYEWGTTDVTRTIAIGAPTQEMRKHFTLVLKGHFALATARFPRGTTGAQLDTLARMPLWQENLDYAHGTGHGVGCYLGVHEEAASISGRSNAALEPGMLISNEPGYYKEGEYGIRIESLVLVKEAGACNSTGRLMLEFETVTHAPIDRRLIDADMLSQFEREWVDAYHEAVYKTLSPHLDEKPQSWLREMTAPL